MGKSASTFTDRRSLAECRASIKKMSAHMLLGARNQFNSNVRDGTMGFNYGTALVEAFKDREDELKAYKAEVARRPYVAFLENTFFYFVCINPKRSVWLIVPFGSSVPLTPRILN